MMATALPMTDGTVSAHPLLARLDGLMSWPEGRGAMC